ncbi:MAG TPA: hypothetical protein VJ831_00695 [Jatrophihabitantaceae bacterium]|nr:hypothetical protein [Jatrophihabitantaceae bacterium]
MTTTNDAAPHSPLLDAVLNLSRDHREHEKFYATAPRERAVVLQRDERATRQSCATTTRPGPIPRDRPNRNPNLTPWPTRFALGSRLGSGPDFRDDRTAADDAGRVKHRVKRTTTHRPG